MAGPGMARRWPDRPCEGLPAARTGLIARQERIRERRGPGSGRDALGSAAASKTDPQAATLRSRRGRLRALS